MSSIAAITTVVSLDFLVLALLAYVMHSPFRMSRDHAEPTVIYAEPTGIYAERPRAAAERVAPRPRPMGGPGRPRPAPVGMPRAA